MARLTMMKASRAYGLAALLFAAACERNETVKSEYPNAQAAISAGAIQRGWIPAFLPSSATQIIEKHNLDTNEVWLRFLIDPKQLYSIEKRCQPILPSEIVLPRRSAGDWWPDALTEKQRGAWPAAEAYTLYRCENGGLVAVEADGRSVFYWHVG